MISFVSHGYYADRFEDISLNQVGRIQISYHFELAVTDRIPKWLALTPPDVVKAHLDFDDATIAQLSKIKPVVMGPGSSA